MSGEVGALVLVLRCSERPVPWVPSTVVQCSVCGVDCWLSARTGGATVGRARTLAKGKPVAFVCDLCERDMNTEWQATPEAIREAFGSVN